MMQTVKRWQVDVTFMDRVIVIWLHDNFLSNVLRTVAMIDFSMNGLEQPTSVRISEAVASSGAGVVSSTTK